MYYVIDLFIYLVFLGGLVAGLIWFICTLFNDVPKNVVNPDRMTDEEYDSHE